MMDRQELRSKLGGVISFPVSPFKKDLSLDIDGHRTNMAALLKFPLCATVAAGGSGEVYSLTPDEYRQVVEATVQEVNGAIPVIAGVGYNMPMAVEMTKVAEAAGADGILCLPPYYPNAHAEGMLHYYQAIGKATELGLFIYSRDWAAFSPTEVARLAETIPNLIAWKDGQADVRTYARIMERVGDRLHWIGGAGDDMVPGYYSMGIRTYTSSIASIAPRLSMQLHERASSLDMASLSRLMSNYVLPLYALRARRKGYEVSVMKAAMEILGKPAGPVRPPLVSPREEEIKEIEALMERYKPVL
jgi:5-dehydro-4-deoxyglucarate dehydratase